MKNEATLVKSPTSLHAVKHVVECVACSNIFSIWNLADTLINEERKMKNEEF